jgi:hypothetical protein
MARVPKIQSELKQNERRVIEKIEDGLAIKWPRRSVNLMLQIKQGNEQLVALHVFINLILNQ